MRSKGLYVLGGLTLLAMGAAGWAIRSQDPAAASPAGEAGPLFPELGARVNDVAELTVEDGQGSVTLRRTADGWTLADRGGFPASFEKVKELVVGVSEIEIEEPKSRKPENHAALGVEAPGALGGTSKRIVLKAEDGTDVAALILSEPQYRRGSQAHYARREGEDQVYLCAAQLTIDTSATGWIERELIRLESDRVQSVSIVRADGEEVLIGRDPENHTQFVVENLPPGREPSFAGVANSVGTALSYLGLDDVRPTGEVDFTAEPLARARYRCHDGLVLEVETARVDDTTWARVSASYEAPAEEEAIGPAPEDPGAEVADDEADPEAIRAEAEELTARHAGWAYAIPDYKGDVLARRMAELLAELEDAPDTPEPIESGETLDLDELLQGVEDGDESSPPAEDPVEPEETGEPVEDGR